MTLSAPWPLDSSMSMPSSLEKAQLDGRVLGGVEDGVGHLADRSPLSRSPFCRRSQRAARANEGGAGSQRR